MQLLCSKGSVITSFLGTPHTQTSRVTPEDSILARSLLRRKCCQICQLRNAGTYLCRGPKLQGGSEGTKFWTPVRWVGGQALQASETQRSLLSQICSHSPRQTCGLYSLQDSISLVVRPSSQSDRCLGAKTMINPVSSCFLTQRLISVGE